MDDLVDYAHAAEARLQAGDRAHQFLVDVMYGGIGKGDFALATRAERALRVVERLAIRQRRRD